MPRYTYRCPEGHVTELQRPVDSRDHPTACDACGDTTKRVFHAPGFSMEGRAFIYRGDPNSWFE